MDTRAILDHADFARQLPPAASIIAARWTGVLAKESGWTTDDPNPFDRKDEGHLAAAFAEGRDGGRSTTVLPRNRLQAVPNAHDHAPRWLPRNGTTHADRSALADA
ncbi:conserved protein of unknown function [Magnetospirillum sp. XM-1]|uniref:hypothetical protein n=1 Tax=Magnetospirillum sp. XM-1 TaxID=1663591 RepID=UPI00073DBBCA|nr:hypothetical protein [Magnetospirillum sp. XM-1]CUW39700.1 conserved protein of unknown function [Magnetospirillum sp. XM-1]